MKSLEVFLKSLQETFKNKRGIYIPKYIKTPTKINCIEHHRVEVWNIDGNNKNLISLVDKNYNTNDYTISNIEDDLSIVTIINILKYYGL